MGALTSNLYAFRSRSWLLKSIKTHDFFDSLGTMIRVDVLGIKIARILPIIDEQINEEWISDKIRFSYDAVKHQRLVHPMLNIDNNLVPVTWMFVLQYLNNLKSTVNNRTIFMDTLIGPFVDYQTLNFLRRFLNLFGSRNLRGLDGTNGLDGDIPLFYKFNTPLSFMNKVDFWGFFGVNLRFESPVLYTRINSIFRKNIPTFGISFGSNVTNKFMVNLGCRISDIVRFIEGRNVFSLRMINSRNPLVIFGSDLYQRIDNNMIYYIQKFFFSLENFYNTNWNGINFLPKYSSTVGGVDLGFYNVRNYDHFHPSYKASVPPSWLLLVEDENVIARVGKKYYDLIIYQGHHGSENLKHVDLVLPSTMPFEKSYHTMFMDGSLKYSNFVVEGPKQVKTGFKLFKALNELWFDVVSDEDAFSFPFLYFFNANNSFLKSKYSWINRIVKDWFIVKSGYFIKNYNSVIETTICSFHVSHDTISRNSVSMIKCSFENRKTFSNHIL